MVFLGLKMRLYYLYYYNKVIRSSRNFIIIKIACPTLKYNWKCYIILFL